MNTYLKKKKNCSMLLFLFIFLLIPAQNLLADEEESLNLLFGSEGGARIYEVKGREYRIYFNDELDYLGAHQEKDLIRQMIPVTAYGNVAFKITRIQENDFVQATGDLYHDIFGNGSSGTIFLIDMNHRQLILYSDGAVYKTVTKSYANTITDNVYRFATDGDYYQCAAEAFKEITMLLEGSRIRQPMKHITNALLAVILSSLILYIYLRRKRRPDKAETAEILTAIGAATAIAGTTATFRNSKKIYNPRDSGSGDGGGFGGGGGGGGSGGGGSHGF